MSRIKGEKNPSLSDLRDEQRAGRPSSAVNPGNRARAEELIRNDRTVTIDDIAERLGISYGKTAKIVGELCFAKFVPSGLRDNLRTPTSKPIMNF